jgi:hypothetical protein
LVRKFEEGVRGLGFAGSRKDERKRKRKEGESKWE